METELGNKKPEPENRREVKLPRFLMWLWTMAIVGCAALPQVSNASVSEEQKQVKVKVDSLSTIMADNSSYGILAVISAHNPTETQLSARILADDTSTPFDDQIPIEFEIPGELKTENMSVVYPIDQYMELLVTAIAVNGYQCYKSPQLKNVWECTSK